MKSHKRGQGAMEYLMTYGWAIIVVMIVGLALWNAGILKIGPTYPKGFSGFSGVRPLDWCVDVRATPSYDIPDAATITVFAMTIVNAEGAPIRLRSYEAIGQCTTDPDGKIPGAYILTPPPGWTQPNDVARTLIVSYDNPGNPDPNDPDAIDNVHRLQCTNAALGEPYKFQFIIEYNKTIEMGISLIHKSVGYIWGTFESGCYITY